MFVKSIMTILLFLNEGQIRMIVSCPNLGVLVKMTALSNGTVEFLYTVFIIIPSARQALPVRVGAWYEYKGYHLLMDSDFKKRMQSFSFS